MLIAISCITCVVLLYIALWWPLRNPYKFNLYIGKKGSGKTTWLTKLALQYVGTNHTYWETTGAIKVKYRQPHKRGRPMILSEYSTRLVTKPWTVYSNVDLNIPGIRIINAKDLGVFRPESPAVVLIDEVNLIWDNRAVFSKDKTQKLSSDTQAFFRLQRHFRTRIYAFSQTFDTDRKLRALCDNLWLCRSYGLFSIIRKIDKKITIKEAALDADSQIVDELKFAPWFIPGNVHFVSLRKYRGFFKSFNPPDLPDIPYKWSANTNLLNNADLLSAKDTADLLSADNK